MEKTELELKQDVKNLAIEKTRLRTIKQEKTIKKFLGIWSRYSGFTGQAKYFYRDLEVWKNTKKDLFHKEEVSIIHSIHRQFKSCIRILNNELITDQLTFRTDLKIWREKVDKKLKALEKR